MVKSPFAYGLLACGLLGACNAAMEPVPQRSALRAAASRHVVLPWGEGPAQAGLHRAVSEALDEGPSAVAIASSGDILVADRLNHRVLRIGSDGVVGSIPVAPDVELIAAGPKDSLVAYSALRSRVWISDAQGQGVAEMAVPRELRNLQAIALGASRRVEVTNSFQETFQLGSPSFPLPLEVVLQSKEEGVLRVDGNKRVQVVRENGVTQLQSLDPRAEPGARGPIVRATLEGDAAQLVGETGDVACVRAEAVSGAPAIVVERRAVCVDTKTGKQVLSVDLPAPGLYVPRQELAVGAGRMVSMVPQSEGLVLDVYDVPGVRGGGGK